MQKGEAVGAGETLVGHEGPVWQVAWAHPSFGTILASASYDGKVFIWKNESTNGSYGSGGWARIKDHALHTASVNAIAWAPHELGATLACASSCLVYTSPSPREMRRARMPAAACVT